MTERRLAHILEAAAATAAGALFRALPLDAASRLGGAIARRLGPHLKVSERAEKNLRRAFPTWDDRQIAQAIHDMWDNLGRTAAEYPNLQRFDCYAKDGRIVVDGVEHIDRLRDDGRAGIFFSGHLANWRSCRSRSHNAAFRSVWSTAPRTIRWSMR